MAIDLIAKVMRNKFLSLIDAFLGRVPGKLGRFDAATRMAMDADFSDYGEPTTPTREPHRKIDQIAELDRILREGK
jgi:hypothetical protein